MSSTGRGKRGGGSKDFFGTPPSPVVRLLERHKLPGGAWLESGAGEGGIIRTITSLRSDVHWTAIEARERCRSSLQSVADEVVIEDFAEWAPSAIVRRRRWDVSVVNPAFPVASITAILSMELVDHLALLQRSSWLGDQVDRLDFYSTRMPAKEYVIGRIDFDGRGGDSTTYSWFVWEPGDRKNEVTQKMLLRRPTDAEQAIDKLSAKANAKLVENEQADQN